MRLTYNENYFAVLNSKFDEIIKKEVGFNYVIESFDDSAKAPIQIEGDASAMDNLLKVLEKGVPLEADPLGKWIDIPFTKKGFRSALYNTKDFTCCKAFNGDIIDVSRNGKIIIENCKDAGEINFYNEDFQKIKTLALKYVNCTRFAGGDTRLMLSMRENETKPKTFHLYDLTHLLSGENVAPYYVCQNDPYVFKEKNLALKSRFSLDLTKKLSFLKKNQDTEVTIESTIDSQKMKIKLKNAHIIDMQSTYHPDVIHLVHDDGQTITSGFLLSLVNGKTCEVNVDFKCPKDPQEECDFAYNVSPLGYYFSDEKNRSGVALKRLPADFFTKS